MIEKKINYDKNKSKTKPKIKITVISKENIRVKNIGEFEKIDELINIRENIELNGNKNNDEKRDELIDKSVENIKVKEEDIEENNDLVLENGNEEKDSEESDYFYSQNNNREENDTKEELVIEKDKNINENGFKNKLKRKRNNSKTSLNEVLNKSICAQNINEEFVCQWNNCSESFKKKIDLLKHKLIHKYKCNSPECYFETSVKRVFKSHSLSHSLNDKPFNCEHNCDKKFKDKHALREHHLRSHPEFYKDVKDYECPQIGCNFKHKLKRNFNSHMKSHSLPFCCDKCDKRYAFLCLLRDHRSIHSEDRTFNCHKCGKSYKIRSHLRQHLKTHDEKVFKCDFEECSKVFSCNKYLYIHKRSHFSTNKYFCDWSGCEKYFSRISALKDHKNTHTGEKRYVCEWPECGKVFLSPKYLSIHRKYHQNKRLHVCLWPGCEYSTNNGSNLVKHKDIHTKQLKYACDWPQCQYKTSNHSNLMIHLKQHNK